MNKKQIQDLLNQARRDNNTISKGVYEDLLSRIGNREILNKVNELSESDIISLLKKMSDEREESFSIYTKNNRIDSAIKEQEELDVIRKHLPKTLLKEELEVLVSEYLETLQNPSKKMMGSIIKYFKDVLGNKLDIKILSEILNKKLT